uniref:Regulator of chromosome condensation (RCC1) repeat-containing protein n=1 Tax=Neospora caninum (strain Liverpool) TaxID=572307 RepID=A0A0F7U7K8_NEOCL|nr:TPA: regulator of chromosome condensation (RCC1) repeat-containing protein [Neospora caninum Liverpool]
MGQCATKNGGVRGAGAPHLSQAFRGAPDSFSFDEDEPDEACLLSLHRSVLHNLNVSLWSGLLFNASGAHRRMYWVVDFGDPLSPQLIRPEAEAKWDLLHRTLRPLSQAERVRRLPELPTLAWFQLLVFYEAEASKLLQVLTEALTAKDWERTLSDEPNATLLNATHPAREREDKECESGREGDGPKRMDGAEDTLGSACPAGEPQPCREKARVVGDGGLRAPSFVKLGSGKARVVGDGGLRAPSFVKLGSDDRGQDAERRSEAEEEREQRRKIAFLSNAFAQWSAAMHRSYLLSQHLSWLTSIVAHALTTPGLRKLLALALYDYYTEERPRLGFRQPRSEVEMDDEVRAALNRIVAEQLDQEPEERENWGAESVKKKKSSRILHREKDCFDVYGYLGLQRVAQAVKDYVDLKRIETDTLHLDVLDWAVAGFEFKGVVFVLVHDQEFWSAVRTEFRCCQVLRAAARPTDVHLAAKCGRLCAVEGFGLRVLASPLVPHCVEPVDSPLPYAIAGDLLLKAINSARTQPPISHVLRVPNPQNQLSLYAPRFQALASGLTPYAAVTEELMALGPPHLWWKFAQIAREASAGTSLLSRRMSLFSASRRRLSYPAERLGPCGAAREAEIRKQLLPVLAAYVQDAHRGISRRFLYDFWALSRTAPPPQSGCLGRLLRIAGEPRRPSQTEASARARTARERNGAETRRDASLVNARTLEGCRRGGTLTIVKEYDPLPAAGEGLSNHPEFAIIFDGTSWTRPAIVQLQNGDMDPALKQAAELFGCSQNDILPYHPLDETIGEEQDDFAWAFGHKCSIWTFAKGPKIGCGPDIRSAGQAPKVGTAKDYFQVDTIGRVYPHLEGSNDSTRSLLRMCLPWSSSKFVISLAPRARTIRPETYLLFPLIMPDLRREAEAPNASVFHPSPLGSLSPASLNGEGSPERRGREEAGPAALERPDAAVHHRILAVLRQHVSFLRHGGHLRKIIHHFGSNVGLTLWLLWMEVELRVHKRVAETETVGDRSAPRRASGLALRSPRRAEHSVTFAAPGTDEKASLESREGTWRSADPSRLEEARLLHRADQLVRELVACEIVATAVKRVVRMYTSELPDRPLPFVYAVEALLPVLFRPELWWRQVEKMLPNERRNMRHHESCLMVALWLSVLEASQVVAMQPWELVSTFNSILRTARSVPTTLAHCLMHALNVEFSSSFLYIISTVPESDDTDWFGRIQAMVQRQHGSDARRREAGKRTEAKVLAGLLRRRDEKGEEQDADSAEDELVDVAKANAVMSLNTFVLSQNEGALDDLTDEPEEENRERREERVESSVHAVDVAAKRLLSLDVGDLYHASSMLVRAHFKRLELLPTEEAIATELLLLHGLREHLTPAPLLLEMRRQSVACARRISRAVAPRAASFLAASTFHLGARLSPSSPSPRAAWPQAEGVLVPRPEKFDSFIGRLLANNVAYAHDSAMAQYRLLVLRRFLEQEGRRDDATHPLALHTLTSPKASVFSPFRLVSTRFSADGAALDRTANREGVERAGQRDKEALPEVLNSVTRGRHGEAERRRVGNKTLSETIEKGDEEGDETAFAQRIRARLSVETDAELADYLTPMQLGMLDGCRLLRSLSEAGSSTRVTTLYAGHTMLTWTLILISQAGVDEAGYTCLLGRCVRYFAAVEEVIRSVFAPEIEIVISLLALRGLVALWNGALDAAKDLFVEALLLLFDAWGDPRLYGGRGHPFLLFLSWTLSLFAYLARDAPRLRAYAAIFRAARLFYPSCPLSLAAPRHVPAAQQHRQRAGLLALASPRGDSLAGDRAEAADPHVKAFEAYKAWWTGGAQPGACQAACDQFVKSTILYNFALVANDLRTWMAATHPANGITFDQTVDMRNKPVGISPHGSRCGTAVQDKLATDAAFTRGVDMAVINYDAGGRVPQSALAGRVLSFGSNVSGQLGLGLPTAPAPGGREAGDLRSAERAEATSPAGGESEDAGDALESCLRAYDDAARRGVDVWWTPQPSVVSALKDVPVAVCSCGFFHNAAIDIAGRLWTWGTNTEGQIGAGFHHYADVPRGNRLEAMSSFSWNAAESELLECADFDVRPYRLFTRRDASRPVGPRDGQEPARSPREAPRFAPAQDVSGHKNNSPAAEADTPERGGAAPAVEKGDRDQKARKSRPRRPFFVAYSRDHKPPRNGEDDPERGEKDQEASQSSLASDGLRRYAVTASVPTLVAISSAPATRFAQVACGRDFTLALTTDGQLFSWGSNRFGCLGTSSFVSTSIPEAIDMGVFAVAVSCFEGASPAVDFVIAEIRCGPDQCAALSDEQILWVWGRGASGELGLSPAYLAMLWRRPAPALGSTTAAGAPDNWLAALDAGAAVQGSDGDQAVGKARRNSEKKETFFSEWQAQGGKAALGPDLKKKQESNAGYKKLVQTLQTSTARDGCVATPTRLRILQFGDFSHFQAKMEEWNLWGEWHKNFSLVTLRRTDLGDDLIATVPDQLLHSVPTPSEEVLVLDIAFGRAHTLCVDISNNLLTWGSGQEGQIAIESACEPEESPATHAHAVVRPRAGLAELAQKGASEKRHNAREVSSVAEGEDVVSPLPTPARTTPCFHGRRLTRGRRARVVAAGGNVSAAVDEDGAVWVWGSNADGLLSLPLDHLRGATPQRMDLLNVKAVSASISPDGKRLAVCTNNGEVLMWGRECFGSLGRAPVPPLWAACGADAETLHRDPARVPLLQGYFVAKASLGIHHTLLLSGDAANAGESAPSAPAAAADRLPETRQQRRALRDVLASPILQKSRESRRASSEAPPTPSPNAGSTSFSHTANATVATRIEYPKDMDAAALTPGPLTKEHEAPASVFLKNFNTAPPTPHPSLPSERTKRLKESKP